VDPLRSKAKERKDHKFEIVIRRDIHPRPGEAGAFSEYVWFPFTLTKGIELRLPAALHRRREHAFTRADRHIEIGIVCYCHCQIVAGIPLEKAEHHARGFILDRGDAGLIHLGIGIAAARAVVSVINTGGRVTDPEAG
jgi:hypothetical protein